MIGSWKTLKNRRITLNRPQISLTAMARAIGVLRSGRLAQGRWVEAFEERFAAMHGARFAVALNSGTSALYSVVKELGLSQDDEVLVPAFTFVASGNAVTLAGAVPVFADVDLGHMNVTSKTLEAAFRPGKTKAVIFVPIFGNPEGVEDVANFCKDRGIVLIIDAAQAHLAEFKGVPIADYAHATVFSFYPTKNMTTLEGGMVVTNSPKTRDFIRRFRNQGMERRYEYIIPGMNFRMSDLQACIGFTQLESLEEWTRKRIANAHRLRAALPGLTFQEVSDSSTHVYHQLTIRSGIRDSIQVELSGAGIESDIYYPVPLNLVAHFRSSGAPIEDLPNSQRLAKEVLSIPVHQNLSPAAVNRVIASLKGRVL